MNTEKNLDTAFADMAKGYMRYQAFAEKAEAEGETQTAKLFRALAETKRIYALTYMVSINSLQSTPENLQEAVEKELYEADEVYPNYVFEAKQENNTEALRMFMLTKTANKIHSNLIEKTLSRKEYKEVDYYVCKLCGHIQAVQPSVCPICGADAKAYKKVE